MNFSNDAKTDIQEVIQEQDPGKKKELYNQYTDEHRVGSNFPKVFPEKQL